MLAKKSECCGCSACNSICSHDAIKMIENEEGFPYPIIDETTVLIMVCVERNVLLLTVNR